MTANAKTVAERKRDWQRGDVAQITNENHRWFPALVVVSKGLFTHVEAYAIVFDESVPASTVQREIFKIGDVEYVGRAGIILSENTRGLVEQES